MKSALRNVFVAVACVATLMAGAVPAQAAVEQSTHVLPMLAPDPICDLFPLLWWC